MRRYDSTMLLGRQCYSSGSISESSETGSRAHRAKSSSSDARSTVGGFRLVGAAVFQVAQAALVKPEHGPGILQHHSLAKLVPGNFVRDVDTELMPEVTVELNVLTFTRWWTWTVDRKAEVKLAWKGVRARCKFEGARCTSQDLDQPSNHHLPWSGHAPRRFGS